MNNKNNKDNKDNKKPEVKGEKVMAKKDLINPYQTESLRDQLYLEARAMAEYLMADGKKIGYDTLKVLDVFGPIIMTIERESEEKQMSVNELKEIKQIREETQTKYLRDLIDAHGVLARMIEPAKPRTILLLDMEQMVGGFWRFLGPVSLIRQMMVAAIISLFFFISCSLSEYVNAGGGNIFDQEGWPLMLNLVFFLSAAGLGASFAGLYKANHFITKGTFDPNYQASYWIRFFLGLIAGLVLSIMVSQEAVNEMLGVVKDVIETDSEAKNTELANLGALLANGIVRPLLAILGGFSADLFYTVLSRLVETIESLFRGSERLRMEEEKIKVKNEAEIEKVNQTQKIIFKLLDTQKSLRTSKNPEDASQQIDDLISDLMSTGKAELLEVEEERGRQE